MEWIVLRSGVGLKSGWARPWYLDFMCSDVTICQQRDDDVNVWESLSIKGSLQPNSLGFKLDFAGFCIAKSAGSLVELTVRPRPPRNQSLLYKLRPRGERWRAQDCLPSWKGASGKTVTYVACQTHGLESIVSVPAPAAGRLRRDRTFWVATPDLPSCLSLRSNNPRLKCTDICRRHDMSNGPSENSQMPLFGISVNSGGWGDEDN